MKASRSPLLSRVFVPFALATLGIGLRIHADGSPRPGQEPAAAKSTSHGPVNAEANAKQEADGAWQREFRRLSEAATQAMQKADWAEAQHLFSQILERDPDHPPILANLGFVEYQLGDFRAAVAYLTAALRDNPQLHTARQTLGMAHFRLGNLHAALAALAQVVADRPDDAHAHNQLAVVLQKLGWRIGAEKSLREAVRLDPDYRDAHYNLALIYLEQSPPSRELARLHYQTALALGMPADDALEKELKDPAAESPAPTVDTPDAETGTTRD